MNFKKSVKEKPSKQERSVRVESRTGKLTQLPAKDIVLSSRTPPIQDAQREEPAERRPEEVEMAPANAPAVFQRLMQQVLSGLNPMEGPDFVAVYLDNVLVFSETMDDHLVHLHQVMEQIVQAGLKLKPTKCQFVRQEVDYLGHVITTTNGLLPNPACQGC